MERFDQSELQATAMTYTICGLMAVFFNGFSVTGLLLAAYGVACLIWPKLTRPSADQLRAIRESARRKSFLHSTSGLPWFGSGPVFAAALTLIVVVIGYLLRG